MLRVAAFCIAAEACALLAFILSHRQTGYALFPLAGMFVFGLSALITLGQVVHKFTYAQVLQTSTIISTGFLCFWQLLGFAFFPGIVKDIDFYSMDNAVNATIILFTLTVLHCVPILLMQLADRFKETPLYKQLLGGDATCKRSRTAPPPEKV